MTPQEITDHKIRWMQGDTYVVAVHSDLDSQCTQWLKENVAKHQWNMYNYTDVYQHTYFFELKEDADKFAEHFKEWVNE